MEPVSNVIILKALDGLSLRSIATAQNIANANSPKFRPLKVTFEEALRDSAPGGSSAVRSVEPKINFAYDEDVAQDVRIDLELATATATSGRYGTLAELLNRQLQLEALALSGNR